MKSWTALRFLALLPILLGGACLGTNGDGEGEGGSGGSASSSSSGRATGGTSSSNTSSSSSVSNGGSGGTSTSSSVTSSGGSSASGGTTARAGTSASGGTSSSGGSAGSGGSSAKGGTTGTGGSSVSGGTSGAGGAASGTGGTSKGGTTGSGGTTASGGKTVTGGTTSAGGTTAKGGTTSTSSFAKFSFFIVSYKAIQALSGSTNGFGGDLRYGVTGAGAGLKGADKICGAVADRSMAGSSAKQWRAFLSVTADENGKQVNAIDRVGNGPWYDRLGRTFALTKADLLNERPANIDAAIKFDLPNEEGVTNHNPDKTGEVDNHDMITGSNAKGVLFSATATCKDWTVADGASGNGKPRVGHPWPTGGQMSCGGTGGGMGGGVGGGDGTMCNWMSALDEAGCAAGVNLKETGGPMNDGKIGSGGGYGGFYCFALTP